MLPLLVERRLIPPETEAELIEAYEFLRRLEHRLQYVNDAQTHMLPTHDDERALIAESMGFAGWPALLDVLDQHRQRVARHFDEIFSEPEAGVHPLAGLWLEQIDGDDARETLSNLGFHQPQAMLERLKGFRQSGKYQQLPAQIRERLDALGPRLIEASAATKTPDATWQRGLDFFETSSSRIATDIRDLHSVSCSRSHRVVDNLDSLTRMVDLLISSDQNVEQASRMVSDSADRLRNCKSDRELYLSRYIDYATVHADKIVEMIKSGGSADNIKQEYELFKYYASPIYAMCKRNIDLYTALYVIETT